MDAEDGQRAVAHTDERLDKLVAHAAGVSRRVARTWIAAGRVKVDGKVSRILTKPLKGGALVTWSAELIGRPTQHAPLGVLFHDRYLVVVDKPAQLLSERDRFGSPSLEDVVPAWLS